MPAKIAKPQPPRLPLSTKDRLSRISDQSRATDKAESQAGPKQSQASKLGKNSKKAQSTRTKPSNQIQNHLNDYLLAVKRTGCSAATVRNYKSDIKQFLAFLGDGADSDIASKPKLLAFAKFQREKGLKDSSIKRKITSISQFKLWLKKTGLVRSEIPLTASQRQQALNQDVKAIESGKSSSLKTSSTQETTNQQQTSKTPNPEQKTEQKLTNKQRKLARKQARKTKRRAGRGSTQGRLTLALNILALLIFLGGLVYLGYQQFGQAVLSMAYPDVPTAPNRILSFQGRLTNTAHTPINTATNMTFTLYDDPSAGSQLWSSNTCSVTPDDDGIFNTNLGAGAGGGSDDEDCGGTIDDSVFTENSNVWLQVTVGAENLNPRQPIRTVAYALNSETVQGIRPGLIATHSTLLMLNNQGELVLGTDDPEIKTATGSGLLLEADSLSIQTQTGSDGDISLSPDGIGNVLVNADLLVDGFLDAPGATLSANYAGGLALDVNGNMSLSGAFQDSNDSAGGAGEVLTSTGTATEWTSVSSLSVGNADTLDSLDSLQFLRSDTSDNYTSGTLTFNSGTTADVASGATLDVNGDLSIADTNITLDGASTNLNATGNFSVNTDDLFVQKSNGYVGIGNSSPTHLLSVGTESFSTGVGQATPEPRMIFDNTYDNSGDPSPNKWVFYNSGTWMGGIGMSSDDFDLFSGGNYRFYTGADSISAIGTERMTITTAGNVGIGDTDPAYTLEVGGDINTTTGTFRMAGTDYGQYFIDSAGSNGQVWSSDGSGRGTWVDSSTVGTDDQTLSEVLAQGNSAGAYSIDMNNQLITNIGAAGTDFTSGGGLTLAGSLDANGNVSIADTDIALDGASTNLNATGNFSVNTNDLFVQKSNGYVGIGTTSPDSALHVVGNIELGEGGSTRQITAYNATRTNSGSIELYNLATGNMTLATDFASGDIILQPGTSGSVGIGTTNPDATAALHLESSSDMGTGLALANLDTGGRKWYIASNGSSNYGGAGSLQFYDATADATRLIIDTTGQVGIGLTSPAYNLDVSGDINFTGELNVNDDPGNAGEVLTSGGNGVAASWTAVSALSVGNADTLDSLDSLQFLRSDTSDQFTSGTLTINSGTTLDVNGDLSIADTNIALDGASTNFNATGNFSVNTDDLFVQKSNGYVGIGTSSPNAKLNVEATSTLTSGDWNSIENSLTIAPTNTSTADFYAQYNNITSTGTYNVDRLGGISNYITYNGSGNANKIYGLRNIIVGDNTGVISDAYGIYSDIFTESNSEITNAYSSYFSTYTEGTITNGYGVYITDIYATNDFGLYQAGSDDYNYFAGNIGVGTTTPSEKLHLTDGTLLIDTPTNPTLEGSYNTSGSAYKVHVSGKYAYVADGSSGLQIIDISNPASPTLTGTYDTSGDAIGVYVSGKYAYVADWDSGLQIVDVSNPTSPSLTGTYDTSGDAIGVYVSGKYAYVADWTSGLQIVDVSDPSSPSLEGNYDTIGTTKGVYVSGKYAYIAVDAFGLQIINISNPASPSLTGTYDTSGYAMGVYVSGKYAYVADSGSGLQIINISNPASPSLTGTYDTSGYAMGVYVSGKYAYVADALGGLQIIDISNPTSPSLTGTYDTSGDAMGVYVSGKYAYVADDTSGLQIIDLGGADIHVADIGNINSNDLTVSENADIGNSLYVRNNLNVGPGGLKSDGSAAITGDVNVTGTYRIAGTDYGQYFIDSAGTSGYVWTSDGSGRGAWQAASGGSSYTFTNGLTESSGTVKLGGALNETTTISLGTYGMIFDMTNTGDFEIRDNGSTAFIVEDSGEVGIGVSAPSQALDISGSVELEDTTSSTTGVIYKGATPFIHNFHHPTGSTVAPAGYNIFIGENTGNFTMGSTATSSLQASYNTIIGTDSLINNTTGYRNTAVGYQNLYNNSSGNNNAILGYKVLYTNTSGYGNAAVGNYALNSNTSGYYNSALGSYSLYLNSTGRYNEAIGYYASYANTTGNNNVAIGDNALFTNSSGSNNVALGSYALNRNTANNNVAVGSAALYYNGAKYGNTAIGYEAMRYADSSTSASGSYNTALGYKSLRGSTTATNNTGTSNTALGSYALYNNTSGTANSALGYQSLFNNTSGQENLAFGYQPLYNNTSGDYNAALGYQPLYYNSTGNHNIAVGSIAGTYADGSINNTTSDYSIYLGSSTKALADGDQNEIVIGYNATGAGSNSVVLGNDSIATTLLKGDVGIDVSSPSYKLDVAGDINTTTGTFRMAGVDYGQYFIDSAGTSGYVWTSDGSGRGGWAAASGGGSTYTFTNGLNESSDIAKLGGTLTESTTISLSTYDMIFDLTDTGEFEIRDNGSTALIVKNNGYVGIGTDSPTAPLTVAGTNSTISNNDGDITIDSGQR